MGEFFKLLRRKIGVATLVVAFVLILILVSEVTIEAPHIRRRDATWIEAGCFVHESWDTRLVDPSGVVTRGLNIGRIYEEPGGSKVISEDGRVITYSKRGMGIERRLETRPHEHADHSKTIVCHSQLRISMLYLVQPLALLSAWLLLSKPRTPKKSQSNDPL